MCVCAVLLVFLASFSLPAHSHRHMSAAAKTFFENSIVFLLRCYCCCFRFFSMCRFGESEIFSTTIDNKDGEGSISNITNINFALGLQ